ncbi:chemotaxis protein CheW [Sulfitobacter sp. JB4-11]|uniref:chemotaxis protein CheW n=1 Tax=Sulfitobacter rhodophyticola TaxID=3238304 RepID=UPI00351712C3
MAEPSQHAYGIVRIGKTPIGIPIHQLSEVCHVNSPAALPIPSDALLGGFELRGSVVPLLHIGRIFGSGPDTENAHLAVVLKCDDSVLAFYVDEVMGIATCADDDVQPLNKTDADAPTNIRGVFKHQTGFVAILDVPAIFELPDVYSAQRPGLANVTGTAERHTRQLTFQAGGALYAVPAIEVYAAVPRQDIKVTAITSGPCLGEISYYGRRVPVACPVSMLGLGEITERGPSEIVVMRFPDDRLLGFAVDAIRNIESFKPDQSAQIPLCQEHAQQLIEYVNVQADSAQIYAVDIRALHEDAVALNLASLSEPAAQETHAPVENQTDAGNGTVVRERERYLVVDVGAPVAIPLSQVSCIMDPPTSITPARRETPGFRGYFSRLGQSVALFGLSDILATPAAQDDAQTKNRRVVLTGGDQKQIGFEVAQVISIEVSEWREHPKDGEMGPAVQLGTKANRAVLPVVDLGALVTV